MHQNYWTYATDVKAMGEEVIECWIEDDLVQFYFFRIVKWINERQYDNKKKLPQHDTIPEVDELALDSSSHGKTTPDRSRNNMQSDSKTLCHTKNISSNNTIVFAYSMDQTTGATQTNPFKTTPSSQQPEEASKTNAMSQNNESQANDASPTDHLVKDNGEAQPVSPSQPKMNAAEAEQMSTKTATDKDENGWQKIYSCCSNLWFYFLSCNYFYIFRILCYDVPNSISSGVFGTELCIQIQ